MVDLERLLAARLLFVTGKGGTGKTTLALAFGQAMAGRGRSVIVVEVDNHSPSFTDYYGTVPAYEPVGVAPGLAVANITWMEALVEWLGRFVPVQRVVRLILGNRMVSIFLDVTPGSREVVIFGRLVHLLESFDTVVVDMPASGHAVSFFKVFFKSAHLFPAGPVRRSIDQAHDTLVDPDTHVVLASLPEEMVVNETIETWEKLREFSPRLSLPLVLLNQGMVPSMSQAERSLLERLAADTGHGSGQATDCLEAELVRAGHWEADRERDTGLAIARLGEETGMELLVAPLMGAAGSPSARVQRMQALLLRAAGQRARRGASS